MKKKLLGALLSTVMVASILAGCGSTGDGGTASSENKSAANSDAGSTEKSGSETAKTELEPVTLHFIFYGDKKAASDEVWDAIADYTRDTLNCDFDVQFIAGTDYQTKLTVMAATGDVWDMNFDSNWTGIYDMMGKDAYLNLDELLPEYAPDLYAKYQEVGVLESAKSKGHIVCLPWTMTMNNRCFFQWRGDLADAAGIVVDKDNFSTVEDVEKLLYQLKEAYPDRYITENMGFTANNFVSLEYGLCFDLNDPTCKVFAIEESQEYVDRMVRAEKWQADGLIWKDVLTDKLDHNSLINQGKLISKWGTHEFSTQNRPWLEEGARWDYAEIEPEQLSANRTPLANAMAISATSENPERVLMFLNMVETDKTLYDLVQYGIEGKTYVLNGEEAAYPEGMDGASSNYMGWGGQWALWKPQFMRPTADYSEGFWEREAEFAASSDKNVVSPLEGFSFDPAEVTTEAAQRSQIYNDINKLLNVGLGGDAKTAIEKLKADSKAAGIDKLIEEYQRQVDEFLASKQ